MRKAEFILVVICLGFASGFSVNNYGRSPTVVLCRKDCVTCCLNSQEETDTVHAAQSSCSLLDEAEPRFVWAKIKGSPVMWPLELKQRRDSQKQTEQSSLNQQETSIFGGDVCKVCKVLAMIIHSDVLTNRTPWFHGFCGDMYDRWFYVDGAICSYVSEVLTIAINKTGITSPVQLCRNPLVGACENAMQTEAETRKELLLPTKKGSHPGITHINGEAENDKSGCGCVGYNCGCCAHVEFDKIDINDTVCANFSYLPAPEYGISFTITLDNKTLINRTMSVKNPPPVCVGVPKIKLADICLRFTNLTVTNKSLSGCVNIEAELAGEVIGEKQLGCFKIPPGEDSLIDGVKRDKKLYFKPLKTQLKKRFDTAGRIRDQRLGF